MRVWKLVSGILSIILFAVVMFQSCAAGVVNAQHHKRHKTARDGEIEGIQKHADGKHTKATRNKTSKGHDIALIVLFGLAAVFGFAGYGNYSDLVIWSAWCLINAVLAVVSIIKNR